jgi:alpha-beta hydrolase superfamily lysophospholipase
MTNSSRAAHGRVGVTVTPMTAAEFWIDAPDGTRLFGRRWPATIARQGTAVLIHGVGEHSGRYGHVAAVMTGCGVDVVGYDQRGFGRSEGKKGRIPADTTMVDDAVFVFRTVAKDAGAAPFLIAHSMGGAIAAFAVTSGAIVPRGLILSSPAIRPQLLGGEVTERALRVMRRLTPNLPFSSLIKPGDVTRDPEVIKGILADPLMHTRVTARLIVSILDQGAAALAAAHSLSTPALLLIAGADKVVHAEASQEFARRVPVGLATTHVYDGASHEVFNDIAPVRTRALADLGAWICRS